MFFCNDDVRQNENFGYGEDINIDINNINNNNNSNFSMNQMDMNMDTSNMMGSVQGPIIEPGRERVIERNIVHEVKHICPMNTKIINNHIYFSKYLIF